MRQCHGSETPFGTVNVVLRGNVILEDMHIQQLNHLFNKKDFSGLVKSSINNICLCLQMLHNQVTNLLFLRRNLFHLKKVLVLFLTQVS